MIGQMADKCTTSDACFCLSKQDDLKRTKINHVLLHYQRHLWCMLRGALLCEGRCLLLEVKNSCVCTICRWMTSCAVLPRRAPLTTLSLAVEA